MICNDAKLLSREEPVALVAAQAAQIAALLAENALLKARLAELERRLGLNSSNSGKPPSSDGLKKPARVSSLREKSRRKTGGQKGHKGETLRQTGSLMKSSIISRKTCTGCSAALVPESAQAHTARQVFDLLPPPQLVVTEHRAHVPRCRACGEVTRASFPASVNAPVQYGA